MPKPAVAPKPDVAPKPAVAPKPVAPKVEHALKPAIGTKPNIAPKPVIVSKQGSILPVHSLSSASQTSKLEEPVPVKEMQTPEFSKLSLRHVVPKSDLPKTLESVSTPVVPKPRALRSSTSSIGDSVTKTSSPILKPIVPPHRASKPSSPSQAYSSELQTNHEQEKPVVAPKPTSIKPIHKIGAKLVSPPVVKPRSSAGTPTELPSQRTPKPVKPVPPQPEKQKLPSAVAASSPRRSSPTPPVPPPRNYARPSEPLPKAHAPDLDLALSSGWFARSPFELPPALAGLNYSTSLSVSSTGAHTCNLDVRLRDLSRIVYKISWQGDAVSSASAEIVSFVESPLSKPMAKSDMVQYSTQFGQYVSGWCLHHMGQQVGRGECWDLAHDALLKGCGKHAFVSTYTHHGYPILEIIGTSSGPSVVRGPEDEIREGDVLQFTSAQFRDGGEVRTAGAPDHTAVVIGKNGDKLEVAEQNVGGVRVVKSGSYVLKHIEAGSVVVYRPVPSEWAE